MSRLKENKVPTGQNILNPNWPDATWDIGVLFVHDDHIISLLEEAREYYQCILPIKSVFGCFNVQWSGGRTSCISPAQNPSGWTPENLIKDYNDREIGCTFTFSNILLKEEHLDDPSSNYLLDLLGRQEYEGNAVAVACDVLSDYIREKYPDLKQKASIVKITTEMPQRRTFEYYESLFEKYDMVYLHPDDNLNLRLLEKISQSGKIDRYELLINERCTFNCSIRDSHYDEISRVVIDDWHGMFNYTNVDTIHSPSHPNSICERNSRPEIRSCTLSKAEFKEIYDMGFRNFKLQGRDTDWQGMLYNFSIWILEPDFIAERFFVC